MKGQYQNDSNGSPNHCIDEPYSRNDSNGSQRQFSEYGDSVMILDDLVLDRLAVPERGHIVDQKAQYPTLHYILLCARVAGLAVSRMHSRPVNSTSSMRQQVYEDYNDLTHVSYRCGGKLRRFAISMR